MTASFYTKLNSEDRGKDFSAISREVAGLIRLRDFVSLRELELNERHSSQENWMRTTKNNSKRLPTIYLRFDEIWQNSLMIWNMYSKLQSRDCTTHHWTCVTSSCFSRVRYSTDLTPKVKLMQLICLSLPSCHRNNSKDPLRDSKTTHVNNSNAGPCENCDRYCTRRYTP